MYKRSSTFAVAIFSVVAVGFTLFTTGCGSDAASGLAITGLNQIPSAKSLVQGNSSSASTQSFFVADPRGIRAGKDLQAVIGTPPNLVDLSWSATSGSQAHPDQVFWDGLVADINDAGTATNDQANRFWGGVDGGPAGQGGCYMAQSVGESVSRLLSGANSQCYMREMSRLNPTFLTQAAANRLVKVVVTGMDEERGGDMHVFIRVYGTGSSEGAAGYAVDLYFCQEGGTNPTGLEQIRAVTSTGVLTMSNYRNEVRDNQAELGMETITAYLTTNASGNVIYDPTKSRTANTHYNGSFGTFKGSMTLDGNNHIVAQRFSSYSFTDHNSNTVTGSDYNYSLAAFASTTGLADLKFTEGAFVGWNASSGGNDHTYSGQMEFQTDHYVSTSSGSFSDDLTAFVNGNAKAAFQAAAFYTETTLDSTAIAAAINANDCSAAVDASLDMDFSTAEIQAIGETCEGDRYDNYNLCRNQAVSTAENIVWSNGNF